MEEYKIHEKNLRYAVMNLGTTMEGLFQAVLSGKKHVFCHKGWQFTLQRRKLLVEPMPGMSPKPHNLKR